MLFLYTSKRIGCENVHISLGLITAAAVLMVYLFCLPHQREHLEAFRSFLNCWHANISFTTENEKRNRMSFFMYRLFIKIKHLPLLFTVYHLPISLVLFRHSLLDASEYAQFGLNYTLNKSLRVNCREINQVTSKRQYLFDKTCQKGLKRSKRSQQNFKNSNQIV